MAEFREIDSYLTDSGSDSDWDERPSLAQKEFDNSILKMGRGLVQAAKASPVEVTGEIPRVVMRLTRLDPTANDDPRIVQTLNMLRDMGIHVEMGERLEEELPAVTPLPTRPQPPPTLLPSLRVNLDLSVLIALISDLTHATLPKSMDEAKRRFIPPKEYLDWKEKRRQRTSHGNKANGTEGQDEEPTTSVEHLPHDLATHSRALRNQLLQEMSKSMIHELRDRFSSIPGYDNAGVNGSLPPIEFWTTTEARDRCIRIVSKIGGVNEKRRAYALFCVDPSSSQPISASEAARTFWEGSRFEHGSLPLFPLHFHSSDMAMNSPLLDQRKERGGFMKGLAQKCKDILDQESAPHAKPSNGRHDFISQATAFPLDVDSAGNQRSTSSNVSQSASRAGRSLESPSSSTLKPGINGEDDDEIPRATVIKANTKLTAHTVESLLWGAELGWTTLTANRTSIKAILKEMKIARLSGRLEGEENSGVEQSVEDGQRDTEVAAIWIVDPRSLAEQMSGGGDQ